MCQLLANSSDVPIFSKAETWFDMKVFYIRVSASGLNNPALIPESLTLHYLPRSNHTALEINGRWIRPTSGAFLTLRRSAVDEDRSRDITYISTDSIRTTDDVCFEVYMRNETLIVGTLEKKLEEIKNEGLTRRFEPATWIVECSCALEYSSKWWPKSLSPALEVYVAGRISGFPIVLAQTVQLIPQRKRFRHRNNTLDVIPEGNENEWLVGSTPELDFYNSIDIAECECNCRCEYVDCSDQEMQVSRFNAGLRIGIGIGVGMCICVGLLMRTCQGSSRPLRGAFK